MNELARISALFLGSFPARSLINKYFSGRGAARTFRFSHLELFRQKCNYILVCTIRGIGRCGESSLPQGARRTQGNPGSYRSGVSVPLGKGGGSFQAAVSYSSELV